MPYNPISDFVGLWRAVSGGVQKAEMPGLDFTILALARAGLVNIIASGTPPATSQPTTAWLQIANPSYSSEGVLKLWDTATASYVPATNALFNLFLSASLTSAQEAQARQNIYAAPFDAMSYNGVQVNGAMGISQENGLGSVTISTGTYKYVVDAFQVVNNSGVTVTAKQNAGSTVPSGFYRAYMSVTASSAVTMGSTNNLSIIQKIEGMRIAKLGWGQSVAQPITIAFWINSTVPGHASLSISNIVDRSYVADVVINAANTWEYKTVTIPGDVTGTWARDNTIGISVAWTVLAGASSQTTADTWTGGYLLATPAQTNLMNAANNTVSITGVGIHLGIEAPSAERSTYIVRSPDRELVTCQRYYQQVDLGGLSLPASAAGTGSLIVTIPIVGAMRIAPTITVPWTDANFSGGALGSAQWNAVIAGVAPATKTGTIVFSTVNSTSYCSTTLVNMNFSGPVNAINSGANLAPIKLDART